MQNFFDKKDFDCNYNPIYPKIFCRLRPFLVGVCVFVCVFVHVCVCVCVCVRVSTSSQNLTYFQKLLLFQLKFNQKWI